MQKEVKDDQRPPENEFYFVGNHLALDLVNTRPVRDGQRVDLVGTFEDWIRWFVAAGPLAAATADLLLREASLQEGQRTMKEVRGLRGALDELVAGLVDGREADPSALEEINRLLALTRHPPEVEATEGGYQRKASGPPQSSEELLGILSREALHLLTEIEPARIRRCEDPQCVLYFYDTSRNQARRWCSMAQCGNRNKVARHYRRHREDRGGSGGDG
jgi:predicted RNA-binding Zn ribbon-like protein